MWERMIFGCDSYHVILWFLAYSILGWFIESTYMSICNRKFINRGFAKGPICPIYGVGALTVFFLLRPYSNSAIMLFLLGSLLATVIELVTAIIMKQIFGEVWWDYKDKPFNYKGVLCLESSIAWGLYTIFLFAFLQKIIMRLVAKVPFEIGRIAGSIILFLFIIDFLRSLYKEKKDILPGNAAEFKEMILNRILK
ncbi:MAG: putative ABC transporter permease [Lachnospiraceae bacterium]|nr:putative ABC transporter permease [Lachnospiraceae bacterium]